MANSELRMDNAIMTRFSSVFLMVLLVALPVRAQTEADAREKVDASLSALKAGEYEKALEGFRDAEVSLPESSELAYNRGVALYRLGEFDEAKGAFAESLSTRDLSLEQRAKFNLGNCAYAQALQRLTDYAGAIEDLRRAIEHYRDALELDPDDQDARANIETAYLLIKDLLDKKKQEEEKKKQDPPTSQPSQDPQCSQPSEGEQEQQQESQNRDSQQQQQQGGEQKPSEQEQPSQPREGELESSDPQERQEQQQAGKPDEKQMRKMTREEAARLLQAVRDRERERREKLRRRQMIGRPPVDRDW
jgi:Ca-activated chloride channel family protein